MNCAATQVLKTDIACEHLAGARKVTDPEGPRQLRYWAAAGITAGVYHRIRKDHASYGISCNFRLGRAGGQYLPLPPRTVMAWNPEIYNRYRMERHAPFFDALRMIEPWPGMEVVDLGCGTGELTRMLADRLGDAEVTGIDSSAEMLAQSGAFNGTRLRFELRDIARQLLLPERFDLVFSNAALQWLPDHRRLFPRLMELLKPGGQLVVQMPAQHRNQANRILYGLATEAPFHDALRGRHRELSMLDPEDYATILFRSGATDIQVCEKIYPLIVPDATGVYEFINGSALRPYLDALAPEMRELFARVYMERLQAAFVERPVFYPFKRILISARCEGGR